MTKIEAVTKLVNKECDAISLGRSVFVLDGTRVVNKISKKLLEMDALTNDKWDIVLQPKWYEEFNKGSVICEGKIIGTNTKMMCSVFPEDVEDGSVTMEDLGIVLVELEPVPYTTLRAGSYSKKTHFDETLEYVVREETEVEPEEPKAELEPEEMSSEEIPKASSNQESENEVEEQDDSIEEVFGGDEGKSDLKKEPELSTPENTVPQKDETTTYIKKTLREGYLTNLGLAVGDHTAFCEWLNITDPVVVDEYVKEPQESHRQDILDFYETRR